MEFDYSKINMDRLAEIFALFPLPTAKSRRKNMAYFVRFTYYNLIAINTFIARIIKDNLDFSKINENLSLKKMQRITEEDMNHHEFFKDRTYKMNFVVLFVSIKIYIGLSEREHFKDTIIDKYESEFAIYDNKEESGKWYRGQTDYSWELLPSFYREVSTSRGQVKKITLQFLFDEYKELDILRKMNKILKPEVNHSDDLNYEKLSYLQHAISYTPLLDFTEDKKVSLAFALSNIHNAYEYNNKDSAIFEIEDNNYQKNTLNTINEIDDFLKNEFYILIAKDYFIGSPVDEKKISYIDDLIEVLVPKYKLINIQTNDRMRYQKGKFIIFYGCLMLGKNIFVGLNQDLSIVKYKIKIMDKKRVDKFGNYKNNFKDLLHHSNPEYDIDNLMQPYKYLNE